MKKKIFIYAYTNMNLGDDLFIKMLCDRYPDTKFYIACSLSKQEAFINITNLTVIPSIPLIDGVLRRLKIKLRVNPMLSRLISKSCNGIVNIGGSIFMQPQKWRNKTKNFDESIINNKPLFVLGSNFGPYDSQEYFNEFRRLFLKTEDVCFRDEYSYNLFSDLNNVRKASDIVFSYTPKSKVEAKQSIVISVIQLSNRESLKKYKASYQNHILEITRKFIKKGYIVTMMGFCENEGDKKAINEIIQMLEDKERKHIKSYIYSGDLEDSLKVIQETKFVLGSRFHAMILAWVFKKPVYPIIYSDKSLNVIQDVDFDGPFSNINSLEEVNIDEVINNLNQYNTIDINRQKLSAKEQFKKLDDFLY